MTKLNKSKLEAYLKKKILPDLEKGRPNWDKPHTLEVVAYIKRIIKNTPNLKVDKAVLIIAAYAHDWGYVGLFDQNQPADFENVKNAKPKHMVIGAKKLSKLLADKFFSFLTKAQKQRCVHLVAIHDQPAKLKAIDELVLMEADMLSGLNVKSVKPTFDFASNKKFIHEVKTLRIPKFINQYSKKEAKKLIRERLNYYKKRLK
ncbi:MAG: HD domain-containing protein [Candidatus Buchananbacteria bacterium]